MQDKNEENTTKSPLRNTWSIRPCNDYKDEYDDCKSIKSRFHQYFVYGETIDCQQWLHDYNNCKLYENSNGNDVMAGEAVIKSEEERRMKRFKNHFGNTVWQKRRAPPDDWAKPLPEWMVKRNENSYLHLRQMEMEEGKAFTPEEKKTSFCTIM